MSDTIGRIPVPELVDSGLTFPLVSDYGAGFSQDRPTVVHQFGSHDGKIEQRFAVGLGPRTFRFQRAALSLRDRTLLAAFWQQLPTGATGHQGTQGPWAAFNYKAPNPDGTTTATKVTFGTAPLTIQYFQQACQVGLTFVEVTDPELAPTYDVAGTCLRFPSDALKAALLSQVQQIIPLVHIRVRETAVDDIYLSDRRCTVGGQRYLPRVLGLGEAGSDVILSQDIAGSADNVQFTFGNADRVMTRLANDTDLTNATIDLSLFHVNSGILLQLWAGFIVTFATDGSPQFVVRASDGLYQVTQQYPKSVVSRSCWKSFDDGAACPYATHGSGGDPASCDYYFDSANGCKAHGMTAYFGGHPASPQGVAIKDNSTGTWGMGRNTVTATSIISDSIWGNALQEIWCNDDGDPGKAFVVKAMIVAGRDESDFYDALGIVGAGPIGAFTGMLVYQNADGYRYIIAPMLDGQPPQGFRVDGGLNVVTNQPSMGLREVPGNDPCNPATDSFSLGQGTPQVWGPQMASGTAFVELRRTDPPGIQASITDSHEMQVPISRGLTGWVWDHDGNRTAVPGLTNPAWIAVNALLRAVGQQSASSAAQLGFFVLSSLNTGDGSGAAEVADDIIDAIVGGGTEKQFRFQGVLAQQKPFRDWLIEILACSLGYFTFEFGKLKLGCRINASAVEAFTLGNILLQSLRLEPMRASFEHLVVDFADQAYQYQANTAEYQDKSHAAYYGRVGAPLTARQHLVGCGTLSQALRLAAVRTREEIGGVTPAEWRNARNASWKTTILALGTEVGQVVSMTHPDIPGLRGTCNVAGTSLTWVSGDRLDPSLQNKEILINGTQVLVSGYTSDPTDHSVTGLILSAAPGNGTGLPFQIITADLRIQSWRLNKDWSIDITAKTVTGSMYDLTVGPKPIDVAPSPLPGMWYPIPFGPAWAPYQVEAASNDALFPGEWTFDSDQEFTALSDGSALSTLILTGKLPVNEFSPGAGGPVIGNIAVNTTGGSLPGGATLRLAIAAIDSSGRPSIPSLIAIIQTPMGTNTNQVVLSGIAWPAIAGMADFEIFASTEDALICAQQSGSLTVGDSGTTYTPTSITFSGPLARSTWALPSPYVSRVRVKAKLLVHSGVAGLSVTGLASNAVICAWMVDPVGTFDPTGRILSAVGRPNDTTPFASFKITAFDRTTGAMTVDRDPTGILLIGDAVVIRNVGTSLTATPTLVSQVTDTGYQNIANGYGGMTPGKEVGNLIRIIKGTGRNQPPSNITANTPTQLTFQPPLLMDVTSVWIVEGPTWAYQGDSSAAGNAVPSLPAALSVPTANFILQPMLIAGFTVDVNGNESPDNGDAPIREDWIYGSLGTTVVSQSMTQLPTHCTVQFDTASKITGTTTTLNADIVAGATSLVLDSNYTEPNGTYLTIDNESFLVTAGTGTPTLTVAPAQLGTTAASHLANSTVFIPGCLVYSLLAPGAVPNQNFYGHKNTADINYVKIVSPSGVYWILTDRTPARGTVYLKAPAA